MRYGHHPAEHRSPLRVGAQEFEEITRDSIEKHVESSDLTIEALAPEERYQDRKNKTFSKELIDLRGMKADVQRCSDKRMCQRIGECHSPRQIRGLPIATAGCKTSQASNCVADGDAWREGVGGLELRHLVAHCIEITTQNREQQSA